MRRKLDEARTRYCLLAEAARDRLARTSWLVESTDENVLVPAGLQPYQPFLREHDL